MEKLLNMVLPVVLPLELLYRCTDIIQRVYRVYDAYFNIIKKKKRYHFKTNFQMEGKPKPGKEIGDIIILEDRSRLSNLTNLFHREYANEVKYIYIYIKSIIYFSLSIFIIGLGNTSYNSSTRVLFAIE